MSLKKLISIAIAILMLTLSACAQQVPETSIPETTPEPTTEEPTTEAPTEPANPYESREVLNLATGEMTGQWINGYAEEEGDLFIANLIAPTIYSHDRNGRELLTAENGYSAKYAGQTFNYATVAGIYEEYDAENDISTYTIKLNPKAKFSNGTQITADDLIYTYYVYCDNSYNGAFSLKESAITGLRGYRFNDTAAENVFVSEEEIKEALAKPSDDLKKLIRDQIIYPTLKEEQEWCSKNWDSMNGYYITKFDIHSAEEFFVLLYTSSLQPDYEIDGKTFDQIVEDTTELFGMNYKTLARNYQNDLEYFNDKVELIVENYLYSEKLKDAGGTPIDYITGINKLDNLSINIAVKGKGDTLKAQICNISILSLEYYGDKAGYNYDAHAFGLTRGDVSVIRSKLSAPMGYGPFEFAGYYDGKVYLEANTYYFGNKASAVLCLNTVAGEDEISEYLAGNIDILSKKVAEMTDEELLAIAQDSQSTKAIMYNSDSYSYFGINCDELKLGDKSTSSASLHLRKAIAIIIAQARREAISECFDSEEIVMEYSFSTSFWGTPTSEDEGYQKAFSVNSDGEEITADNYIESARAELKAAGYKYKSGKATAPKGGKKTFEILVPAYVQDDDVLMKALEKATAAFAELDITLKRTDVENIDEFILQLASGGEELWIAQRSTASPKLAAFYSTGGSSNYYNLADAKVDELINTASATIDPDEKAAIYKQIYMQIMTDAVEIPIYQSQAFIFYRNDKLTIPEFAPTEYYNYPEILSAFILNRR